MSSSPVVLVLSSSRCELSVVTPVLAALEANGSTLRAFDTGREEEGAVSWVLRTLSGEADTSKLADEISSTRPDVAVCFEPESAQTMCGLRSQADRLFPIVAIVPELAPSSSWGQCDIERFFVVDDEAAVSLEDVGVPGHNIVPVGGMGAFAYAYAGRQSKSDLKKKFGISGRVALVLVEGLGAEESAQLATQLSLVKTQMTYLFDAGVDTEVAAVLRSQVPQLGMKAKLFGKSDDAPLYWRCSDVVIGAARTEVAHRCMALSLPLVCLAPRPGQESRNAEAIEERGQGAIAATVATVAEALSEALALKERTAKTGEDGANTIADAVFIVGQARDEIIAERNDAARSGRREQVSDATEFADWVDRSATPAGGLEDLGGGGGSASPVGMPARPDIPKLNRLLEEIVTRRKRVTRTIGDAQRESGKWDREKGKADQQGHKNMVERAQRNGDMERARMHSALSEMAELATEEKSLERAIAAALAMPEPPPVRASPPPEQESSTPYQSPRGGTSTYSRRPSIDEELNRMRENAGSDPAPKKKRRKRKVKTEGGVDDALAALKRKMAQKRKK